MRREGLQVLAAKENLAGAGAHQAADCAQGRAFAGAIAADERHDFAFVNMQRNALQRVDVAVAGVNLVEQQQGVYPLFVRPLRYVSRCSPAQIGLDHIWIVLDLLRGTFCDFFCHDRAP